MKNSKLKVLLVSQYFWPEEFRINDVVRSLIDKGVQIDVLTGKPNYPSGKIFSGYKALGFKRELYFGAKLSRVPLLPRGSNSKFKLAINYCSFILSGLIFGPWMQRGRKYDLIFVYGLSPILLSIPALYLAHLKKVPVVIWVQDLWPASLSATGYVKNKYALLFVEKLVRFIYSRANLLLVQSEAFIDPVRVLAPFTPIKYYPNSVDEIFSYEMQLDLSDFSFLNSEFVVMFAGNIGSAQSVEVIIEAANLLKNEKGIQFVILGDGSRRQWMADQIKTHQLCNVHLPGRFPVETMPGFLQKADVLLVTLADQEIFATTIPNKIQAYLATGRPIIACMRGEGARVVSTAKAGLAVPAEDGVALSQAILRVHTMTQDERDEMGNNGREYFEKNFNHDYLVNKLIGYLEQEVINARSFK
jgi:glycosyltransferase involved in cell wall biosynthesis